MKNCNSLSKNIFQIYHDKSLVGSEVSDHIVNLNSEYSYHLLDFDECLDMLRFGFDVKFFKEIECTFKKIPRYCHQSDLLRYCLLYLYGGIYIDPDLKPLMSFDKIIPKTVSFFSSFGQGGEESHYIDNKGRAHKIHTITANGIIGSLKENTILLDLIRYCISNPADRNPYNRGVNVYFLYDYFEKICLSLGLDFKPFRVIDISGSKCYFFNQTETELGSHTIVNSNKEVIIDPECYSIPRQTSSYIT